MATVAEKNCQRTKSGVSAICHICDARSRPVEPDQDGEPTHWNLPCGWSITPFPPNFKHSDGSVGAQWTCPKCVRRFRAGERLYARRGRIAQAKEQAAR